MSAAVVLILTFLVSMVPVIELKGAIPMGVIWSAQAGYMLSPWAYFAAAFIGSCIPAFIILPFLKPVLKALGRTKLFAKLSAKLDAHFEKKAKKVEQKNLAREEKKRAQAQEKGRVLTDEQLVVFEKRRHRVAEFFRYFSVFLFVAVPLPLTGCWTGSAIAVFLGCKARYAAPCIVLGNLIAGLIIMLVTIFVGDLFHLGVSFS